MAEIECASEKTCIGILDEICKNKDVIKPYRLCKRGYLQGVLTSPQASCIEQKKKHWEESLCLHASCIQQKKKYRGGYLYKS